MTSQNYQSPRFRDIAIAIVIFIVLLALLCNLPNTVKWVGDVFLYIPSQLGLVQRVAPEEIQTIDLRTHSPALIEITRPGRYAVFTGDYELLTQASSVVRGESPWLSIKAQATHEHIRFFSVERGLYPYDTPLADGRPIFIFEISVPGNYEIEHSYKQAFISIVPDYTTGKESVIMLAYALQVAILLVPLGVVCYRRYQRYRMRIKSIEAPQAQKRAQGEAFWEEKIRMRKEKTPEKQ